MVKYVYDAWGKILSTTCSLASTLGAIQPFRYRSYMCDQETGLYYLRSRYYSTEFVRFLNSDNQLAIIGSLRSNNIYSYASNNPVIRVDSSGKRDYIYTSPNEFTIENDWGIIDFLNDDRYYVMIDGVKYHAHSKETVTLTNWSAIDLEFSTNTINKLINRADAVQYSIDRVMNESIGGDLDFKRYLNPSKLYYDSKNKVLYNRNEAGNYAWAFYLTLYGADPLQGLLAQGGSVVSQFRFDESWDYKARWNGVLAAYERTDTTWLFYHKYFTLGCPMF